MPETMEVRHLHVSYGSKEVLRDLSFSIGLCAGADEHNRGEICAVLGRNGSGKSTLLRAICGLIPFTGSIRVSGQDISSLTYRARAMEISYMSAMHTDVPPITAGQAVEMGFYPLLGLLEAPGEEKKQKAHIEMERLGIDMLAHRLLSQLSGGERQLVMFARALVRETPLMVLDEPDSALDLQHQRVLMEILRERAEMGISTILSSHHVNSMLYHADRLLLLESGILKADIRLKDVDEQTLRDALSSIYGSAVLIPFRDRYQMAEV